MVELRTLNRWMALRICWSVIVGIGELCCCAAPRWARITLSRWDSYSNDMEEILVECLSCASDDFHIAVIISTPLSPSRDGLRTRLFNF